jgi:parvulin-like peptidyl-prolyl isomerase
MLRLLRKKKTMKRILWVLAAIIVPAFVFWGAGEGVRSWRKGPSFIGTIHGKKVSFKTFAESYEACFHQLVLASGGNADRFKTLKESVNVNQMAWERLVLLEAAKRQNVNVTDKEIIQAISSNPLFGRNGAFDRELYNHILSYTLRAAPRKFEEEMRGHLIIAKLREKIVVDVAVSENDISEAYMREHDTIRISYVLIDPASFTDDISPTPEELSQFYEENKEMLRKGDEVNIRYFMIPPDDEDLLAKIADDQRETRSLDELATHHDLTIEETGFFGMKEEIPHIGWNYELAKTAFALEKGMTSLAIYTQKGYYVIEVKEKRSGYLPESTEIDEKLTKAWITRTAASLAEEAANKTYQKIQQLTEEGKDFTSAAKATSYHFGQSPTFARQDYVEGLGQAMLLKEAAFSLAEGEIGSPVRCEKGFVIFTVDERIPADEKQFEEEREAFRQRLVEQKRAAAFNNWFTTIVGEARLAVDLNLLPD